MTVQAKLLDAGEKLGVLAKTGYGLMQLILGMHPETICTINKTTSGLWHVSYMLDEGACEAQYKDLNTALIEAGYAFIEHVEKGR